MDDEMPSAGSGDARGRAGPEDGVNAHQERLLAVTALAGAVGLADDVYLQCLLDEGARGIAPAIGCSGFLVHLDEGDVVFDLAHRAEGVRGAPTPGARIPLEESLLVNLMLGEATAAWADIHGETCVPLPSAHRDTPVRAMIGTPFRVGVVDYALVFASENVHRFDPLDRAYVEILASLCAGRLQRRDERTALASGRDMLTGLGTRETLRAIADATFASGVPHAVVVLDVDRLHGVNDTLGRSAGDAILVEIADALQRMCGHDLVARLGGDSFGLVLRDVAGAADTEARLRDYFAIFANPLRIGAHDAEQRVKLTVSAGIALAPDDGGTFDELIARADVACYQAKEDGRARWRFFEDDLLDRFAQGQRVHAELLDALLRGELALHFQPHVELASGAIVGAEALVRWNHPRRGLLMPADFLPVAQDLGLMRRIGLWVMEQTVHCTDTWRRALPGFRAWFNLSALELTDPDFLAQVLAFDGALEGVGVEITQHVALRDAAATTRALATLRQAGLAIAIDDFGMGASSLARLKRVRVDMLKIDAAVTSGLPEDSHDVAIVDAMVSIADRFGYELLAQGVETRAQQRALVRAGCRWGQGFLFGRPSSMEDFTRLLEGRPPQDAVRAC
jgi:diguanylate cyclase (GGDEF)-like protein